MHYLKGKPSKCGCLIFPIVTDVYVVDYKKLFDIMRFDQEYSASAAMLKAYYTAFENRHVNLAWVLLQNRVSNTFYINLCKPISQNIPPFFS